jgi:hypothetical protein
MNSGESHRERDEHEVTASGRLASGHPLQPSRSGENAPAKPDTQEREGQTGGQRRDLMDAEVMRRLRGGELDILTNHTFSQQVVTPTAQFRAIPNR